MMFNFYPWGLSVNVVIPVSPTQCRVLYRGYVKDGNLAGQGAGSVLDTVEDQDQWVVEAVQRGMGSRAYDRGRYSPMRTGRPPFSSHAEQTSSLTGWPTTRPHALEIDPTPRRPWA